MYRPKPKAVVILEETFLLLKPDAAEHHGAMIDALREAGFYVMSRQMPSTRSLVEEMSYHFTDVAMLRSEWEKQEEVTFGVAGLRRMSRHASTMGVAGSPQHGHIAGTSRRSSLAASMTRRSNTLNNDAASTVFGHTAKSVVPGADGDDRPAWERRREQHTNHILRGTCVAIGISASNAVERVAKFCGPDDPEVARASAPESLRARFGKNIIENAVFCAQNHHVAGELIYKVFGHEPQVRVEAQHEDGGGAASSQQQQQQQKVDTAADLSGTGALSGEGAEEARAQMLFQPGAFLSTIDFHPTVETSPGHDGERVADLAEITTPQQVRVARERLMAERDELRRAAELLRQREVDLLLREEKFAAQMEDLRRGYGGVAITDEASGPTGTAADAAVRGVRAPAPPARARNGPLRGQPVSSHEADGVGGAQPLASQSRALDHRLALRPKARSKHALHAAHLRDVVPGKRVGVVELQKQLREARRQVEMATALDHRTEADAFLSSLWTAVREREQERHRVARVAAVRQPNSPDMAPIGVSPRRATHGMLDPDAPPSGTTDPLVATRGSPGLRQTRGGAGGGGGGQGSPGAASPSSVALSAPAAASPVSAALTPQDGDAAGALHIDFAEATSEAHREASVVLLDVFTNFMHHCAERDVTRYSTQAEELEKKIEVAETQLAGLERELASCEAKPQFVDVDGVEALADLGIQELVAIGSSPGTVTSLFLRFNGARETGRVSKTDFVRFYDTCTAFRDTGMIDDSRRVRDTVHSKYSPGSTTLSLDEFTALLLHLVQQ